MKNECDHPLVKKSSQVSLNVLMFATLKEKLAAPACILKAPFISKEIDLLIYPSAWPLNITACWTYFEFISYLLHDSKLKCLSTLGGELKEKRYHTTSHIF